MIYENDSKSEVQAKRDWVRPVVVKIEAGSAEGSRLGVIDAVNGTQRS